MSLFDTDKTSDDRGTPTPNTHDVVNPEAVMAKQTLGSTYITPSTYPQSTRMVFKNNLLVTYDQNNKVSSVYGYVPGALSTGPVLIVAQVGYDVFTDILGISRPAGL